MGVPFFTKEDAFGLADLTHSSWNSIASESRGTSKGGADGRFKAIVAVGGEIVEVSGQVVNDTARVGSFYVKPSI